MCFARAANGKLSCDCCGHDAGVEEGGRVVRWEGRKGVWTDMIQERKK